MKKPINFNIILLVLLVLFLFLGGYKVVLFLIFAPLYFGVLSTDSPNSSEYLFSLIIFIPYTIYLLLLVYAVISIEKVKNYFAKKFLLKGIELSNQSNFIKAFESFNVALMFNKKFVEAWNNRGTALVCLGHVDDALKSYKNALTINSEYASALYNVACAYSLKGENDYALLNLSKAIKLDESFKKKAIKDSNFNAISDYEEFKNIIENVGI